MSVHWGLPDPAAAVDDDRMPAFRRTFEALEYRLAMLANLPMASPERLEIKTRLERIWPRVTAEEMQATIRTLFSNTPHA